MRDFLFLMIALYAATTSGCGAGGGQANPAPPVVAPPAATFDQTHGGKTVTPNGEVVRGSARDTKDGSIEYQTADGKVWQVKPRPDGTYGEPKSVK